MNCSNAIREQKNAHEQNLLDGKPVFDLKEELNKNQNPDDNPGLITATNIQGNYNFLIIQLAPGNEKLPSLKSKKFFGERKSTLRNNPKVVSIPNPPITVVKSQIPTSDKAQHSKLRCHFCRSKDVDKTYIICCNYPKCLCGFCHDCLRDHFGINPKRLSTEWHCMVCKGLCKCPRCEEKLNNSKTGKAENSKDGADNPSMVLVKEWRKDACLRKESVFHGPKNYDPLDSEEDINESDSGSDYVPGKKSRKKKKKPVSNSRKSHDSSSKRFKPAEIKPIGDDKRANENFLPYNLPRNGIQTMVPNNQILCAPMQFSMPMNQGISELARSEQMFSQSNPMSPIFPMMYPGNEQPTFPQFPIYYLDSTGHGFSSMQLPNNCISPLTGMSTEQIPCPNWPNYGLARPQMPSFPENRDFDLRNDNVNESNPHMTENKRV